MANKINDSFLVNAGGAWSYLARIKNTRTGQGITQAAVASISRLITDTVTGTATTSSITISSTVYDTLQTNTDLWDETFNFLDNVAYTLIPLRRRYTLQYTFTLVNGDVLKTREIDIEGD